MIYTYNCPKCGNVRLFRPAADCQKTICECGTKATRAPGDWCMNQYPPFKPVTLFGVGGRKGLTVHSRDEHKRALRGGWQGDWDRTGEKVAVSPDEVDKMFGFDSRGRGEG